MKKQTIIAILAVVFAAMAMPQNAVAKEKKLKYLGHQYQGEVDKEKVPCGKGVINIGGLVIEGDFKSNTVTNADVYKSDYVKRKNRRFVGSVSFDESNNITLKSSGKIYTTTINGELYFESINSFQEQLTSDLIVNYEEFEPDYVKFTSTYDPFKNWRNMLKEFNPPMDSLQYDFVVKLQDAKVRVKKKVWDYGREVEKDVDVKTKAYLLSSKDEFEPKTLTDYKDSQGRIWNIDWNTGNWSVQYPNGSYFKTSIKNNIVREEYKVICPDGKIYEYKPYWEKIDDSGTSIGNGIYLKYGDPEKDFLNYMKSSALREFKEYDIHSDEYDFTNLPDKEVEKIIKEKFLLPHFNNVNLKVVVWGGNSLGTYENGKYVSYATEKTAKEKAEAAEKKRLDAYWTKKFGFNPSDKKNSDLIKPGRSFALIKEYYGGNGWSFNLSIDHGSSKCYDMYRGSKRVGFIWVSGGKITSVVWN